MNHSPIITSFDDQDAYKFSMQHAILKLYPGAKVRYASILRDPQIEFPPGFGEALLDQVKHFEDIRFMTAMEEHMTRTMPWFGIDYMEYLRNYRFDPAEVQIRQEGVKLEITIEGPWHKTILWEVPLMACISELYYRFHEIPDDIDVNIPRWREKFRKFSSMQLAVIEFGTRRRKSLQVQEEVLGTFVQSAPGTIRGTSNVMFARKLGIPPSGTQAHEWYMFHAARFGPRAATTKALEKWVETYHGALGIALTDTYTTEVFFKDFDLFYSKLFDGIRQDSGDPVVFARKAITHYLDKHIVLPSGLIPKTLVFSDAIDSLEKISAIEDAVRNRILSVYGIGTWLTNDISLPDGTHVKPLNMVIKMTAAQPTDNDPWIPTIKLTDSAEKQAGDPASVRAYLADLSCSPQI